MCGSIARICRRRRNSEECNLTRVPGYCVGFGFAFYALGMLAKDFLPYPVGSHPLIQLPCAFCSAVFIPFGSLLALQALILQKGGRRPLISWHLLGILFGFLILSQYFVADIFENHLLNLSRVHSILPRLIENAQRLPNEQKRASVAKAAYLLYGVSIAYRLDNQEVVLYIPDAEAKTEYRKLLESKRLAIPRILFLEKITSEFPYLFALYAGTYTATFVAGWIWLSVPISKERQSSSNKIA